MLEYEWKYSQKLGYFTSILQNRSLIVSLTKDRFEKSVWTVRWYKKTPCSDDDTNLLTVGCSFLCLPCEFGHRPTSLLYSLCMILIHVKNINTNNIEHSIADCPEFAEKEKEKMWSSVWCHDVNCTGWALALTNGIWIIIICHPAKSRKMHLQKYYSYLFVPVDKQRRMISQLGQVLRFRLSVNTIILSCRRNNIAN